MDDLPGRKLGQYDLIKLIGRGGQGSVYLANDAENSRRVAIKIFNAKGDVRRQKLARFKYEAHLAAALDHPNICTMYALLEDDDHTYMVMEYVEGKNLFELSFKRPLSVETALRIAIQIADALSAAHSRGIVHRDIKPRNVMVTDNGVALLLDFGLAKLMESDDRAVSDQGETLTRVDFFADIEDDLFLTQEGAALGTPSSSPPEMALGLPSDHRGDIFSFGVLLYLLLTGEYPFVAKTKDEVRRMIINEDPIPVSIRRNAIEPAPPELIAIINRAMLKNPDERFQSATDLRDDLKKIFLHVTAHSHLVNENGPVELLSGRPSFAMRKTTWKRRWTIILLPVILVLILIIILYYS